MRERPRELSAGEWAVLAVVCEKPTHGFAVARAMAAEGEIGRVWALPRPLVYRAIDTLQALGLIEERGVERGARGPRRTIVAATPAGRRRLLRWLRQPVEHIRDVRSLLMLKLLFLARREADQGPLLDAQLAVLRPVLGALNDKARSADGFDRTLALWRAESAAAVIRFLESSLAG